MTLGRKQDIILVNEIYLLLESAGYFMEALEDRGLCGMVDWWNNLSGLLQVLYIIAATSTVILFLQMILAIFGIGGDDGSLDSGDGGADLGGGAELDTDSDLSLDHGGVFDGHGVENTGGVSEFDEVGLRLFTIRGFLSFFSIGGWTVIVMIQSGIPPWISLIVGLLAGLATMFLIAKILQLSMRVQSSGNINLRNAIGAAAEVYLTIPANNQGKGKVSVVVQERLREFDAVTFESEKLPTGTGVRVVDMIASDVLVVEKLE